MENNKINDKKVCIKSKGGEHGLRMIKYFEYLGGTHKYATHLKGVDVDVYYGIDDNGVISEFSISVPTGYREILLPEDFEPNGETFKNKDMEKKDFTIGGSFALRKAFIEEYGTPHHDITYLDWPYICIESTSEKPYIASSRCKCDIHFTLPQQWDEAMAYAKEYFKPSEKEFKKGDWVKVIGADKLGTMQNYPTGTILRVVDNDKCYRETCYAMDGKGIGVHQSALTLATESDIKDHLVKIAKEKGFVFGRKFNAIKSPINLNYQRGRQDIVDFKHVNSYGADGTIGSEYGYDKESDTLITWGCGVYVIYSQGKWAKILSLEKILKFGGEDVKIKNGRAMSSDCNVSKEQVEKLIGLINHTIEMGGLNVLCINWENKTVKIGCNTVGTFDELRAINNAMYESKMK